MTNPSARGYEEVPHTADWALRVWAEDLASLFVEAARGMNALSGLTLQPGPRLERELQLEAADEEGLLVAFLSELLYLQEQQDLGFDTFDIQISGLGLRAALQGALVLSLEKPIKAVTFHNLQVEHTALGRQVQIVFDV